MKIAICDDEKLFVEKMKRLINYPEAQIFCFETGEELCRVDEVFDIVFLDIELQDMSGLEVARAVMEKDRNTLILFITAHAHYSTKGYEYRAFRYILKSEPEDFIKRNIRDAISEYKNRHFYINVSSYNNLSKLCASDIVYIEASGRSVKIHTESDVFATRERFGTIGEILSEHGFVQCHKSYIINMKYIDNIQKSVCVNLVGDIRIPVGRKYNSELVERYLRYE